MQQIASGFSRNRWYKERYSLCLYAENSRGCNTYVKPDGKIGTAGKGALIQKDLSATLGVTQDQYLFVPVRKL